jgi:HEAT repeat protein
VDRALDDVGGLLDDLSRRVERSIDEVKAYLASPEGQELRKRVAQVLLVASPLLFRSRLFTATWPGRILGLLGGAALVAKLAEALRDWEPQPSLRVVSE